MYIASKSQKNSSNSTRFFGADVVFFRQTGRKLANLSENRAFLAKKQFANQINFHLYHYAGNNPVKFTDPTGAFDVEDFVDSVKNFFTNSEYKYEKFQSFKNKKITKSEFDDYYSGKKSLDNNQFLAESTKGKKEYFLFEITEFGKLSKEERLSMITDEKENLINKFESNKIEGRDILQNLKYGLGESLFSLNSCSGIEEFVMGYIMPNIENLGDLAQFDIDELGILKDIKYLDILYEFEFSRKENF